MNSKCPECGSRNILHNHQVGEAMCRDCGLMIDESMPNFAEYREGTSYSKPVPTDGRIVKAPWLLSSREKNLQRARAIIHDVAVKLTLPKFIGEESFRLYQEAVNKGLCVGRSSEAILYASIYSACNSSSIPKTAIELTEHTIMDKKDVLRAYSLLQKEMGIKAKSFEPVDLLPRFISNLKLSQQCLTKSMQIMNSIKGLSLYSGKNPKSIVAAAIYIAAKMCNEKVSQRQIANQIGVMEVTIRKRYKEIEKAIKSVS